MGIKDKGGEVEKLVVQLPYTLLEAVLLKMYARKLLDSSTEFTFVELHIFALESSHCL